MAGKIICSSGIGRFLTNPKYFIQIIDLLTAIESESDARGGVFSSMAGFWESCLQRFEQELPAQQFNTWIRPLRLEGESTALESGLRLVAPNGFILKWVRDRYLSRIEDYSQTFFAGPVTIALVIGSGKVAPPRAETTPEVAESKPAKPGAPVERKGSAQEKPGTRKNNYEKSRLFPTFTFDNLVVGKANDLARAAAVQVAHNPGVPTTHCSSMAVPGLARPT